MPTFEQVSLQEAMLKTATVNAAQYLTHQRRFSFDPPPGPRLGFLGRKAS